MMRTQTRNICNHLFSLEMPPKMKAISSMQMQLLLSQQAGCAQVYACMTEAE